MVVEKLPLSAPSTQLNKRHQIPNSSSIQSSEKIKIESTEIFSEKKVKTKLVYSESNDEHLDGNSSRFIFISDLKCQINLNFFKMEIKKDEKLKILIPILIFKMRYCMKV